MRELLSNYYVIGGIIIFILILLFIFRESKIVIEIVGKAIVEAEDKLNGEEGQKKLDYAVLKVQEKLPKILKPLVTKSIIVSIIEIMLKFMNDAFKLNKEIDIKGNE